MKYRHQYHAGNFADVHKHVLLLDILSALTRKDKALVFVDTHAGRGEYDLHPGDAQHPAEWQSGVAKLLAAGIKTDAAVRNSTNAAGLRIAYITDPWGTEIELTVPVTASPDLGGPVGEPNGGTEAGTVKAHADTKGPS